MSIVFAIQSVSFNLKKKLSETITKNGGQISLFLNAKVNYLVVDPSKVSSYNFSTAEKHGFQIVNPEFVDAWAIDQDVEPDPFLVKNKEIKSFFDESESMSNVQSEEVDEDKKKELKKLKKAAKQEQLLALQESQKQKRVIVNRFGETEKVRVLASSQSGSVNEETKPSEENSDVASIDECEKYYVSISYKDIDPIEINTKRFTQFKMNLKKICGSKPLYLLTNDGKLYSSQRTHTQPVLFDFPEDVYVVDVSTSSTHTLALTDDGQVWGWGDLTHIEEKLECKSSPIKLEKVRNYFKNSQIKSIYTGEGVSGVILNSQQFYIWPRKDGNSQNRDPQRVNISNVKSASIGHRHYAILLEDGSVYTWGLNSSGQCGIGHLNYVKEPQFVPVRAYDIACGVHNTACIGDDKKTIFAWGCRSANTLGKYALSPIRLDTDPAGSCSWMSIQMSDTNIFALNDNGDLWSWPLSSLVDIALSPAPPTLVHKGTAGHVFNVGQNRVVVEIDGFNNIMFEYVKLNMDNEFKEFASSGKFSLSSKTKQKESLYHIFAEYNKPELIPFVYNLIKDDESIQASIVQPNCYKESPIHIAGRKGNLECIRLLAKYGVDPSSKDRNEQSPLHEALSNKKYDVWIALLKAGASPNVTDIQQQTPLHVAVSSSIWPYIESAVRCGGSLHIKDTNKRTPLNFCSDYRGKAIKAFARVHVTVNFSHDVEQLATTLKKKLTANQFQCHSTTWKFSLTSTESKDLKTMVFVISPESVESDSCIKELYHAYHSGLSIIPVLGKKTKISDYVRSMLPYKPLNLTHHVLSDQFDSNIEKLVESVRSTIDHGKIFKKRTDVPAPTSTEEHVVRKSSKKPKLRHVRLFVSSTFKDMKLERESLQKNIFPYIRSVCEELNVNFTFVDLRWGITDEETSEGKTIFRCLSEVEKSYPFFLCMLGERYGWHQIQDEDAALQKTIDYAIKQGYSWLENYRDRSVTELEVIQGVFKYLPTTNDDGDPILDRANYFPEISEEEKKEKFKDLRASFLLRNPGFVDTLPSKDKFAYYSENYVAKQRLESLKKTIESCSLQHSPYKNIIDFENQTKKLLTQNIRSLFGGNEEYSPEEIERYAHEFYTEYSSKIFVGKQETLTEINNFVNSDSKVPVVIVGGYGEGKTCLLSKVCSNYREENPKKLVVGYFVGCTGLSYLQTEMCKQIIISIKNFYNIDHMDLPNDPNEYVNALNSWLEVAGEHGGMILCVDGVDRLLYSSSIPVEDISWLPISFPESVRVILTLNLTFEQKNKNKNMDIVNQRTWNTVMLDDFTPEEVGKFSDAFFTSYGKSLPQNYKERLMNNLKKYNPLFVASLLAELCVGADYGNLDAEFGKYIQYTSQDDIFKKMIQHSHLPGDLAPKLVTYLFLTKSGLSEYEILDSLQTTSIDWITAYSQLKTHVFEFSGFYSIRRPQLVSFMKSNYPIKQFAEHLGEYFEGQKLNLRVAREMLHLFSQAKRKEKLRKHLLSLELINLMWVDEYKSEYCEYWNQVGEEPENRARLFKDELDKLQYEKIDEQLKGRYFYLAADVLSALGGVKDAIPQYEVAIKIQKLVLSLNNKASNRDQIVDELCQSLRGIGEAYKKLGTYQKTVDYCTEAVEVIEDNLGAEHQALIEKLCTLSDAWGKIVDLDIAEVYARRAVDIAEKLLGKYHIDTAKSYNVLGVVLKKKKKFADSIPYTEKALDIRKKCLGMSHSQTGDVINNLANIYAKQKQFDKAIDLYELSGSIYYKIFGTSHPHIAQYKYNLGRVYIKQGLKNLGLQLLDDAYSMANYHYGETSILSRKIKIQIYGALGIDGDRELFSRIVKNMLNTIDIGLKVKYFKLKPYGGIEFDNSKRNEPNYVNYTPQDEESESSDWDTITTNKPKRIRQKKKNALPGEDILFNPFPDSASWTVGFVNDVVHESSDEDKCKEEARPAESSDEDEACSFSLFD
eukprot:TRINITY_DN6676_c0_g1_i1.p1 TRINITY_DN6676_c0_g1~~TRINITY_DN6676_c0_g1_i1.p1  ORF type:complete len:1955 (-),score=472.01 TRINITY_DN6676_c0_g1_i1:171-6035(-)